MQRAAGTGHPSAPPAPRLLDRRVGAQLLDVRRAELGRAGKELRALDEAKLRQFEPVRKAFAEADKQIRRYRDALARKYGKGVPRRCYVVVAVGLERLLGEEVPASGRRRRTGGSAAAWDLDTAEP